MYISFWINFSSDFTYMRVQPVKVTKVFYLKRSDEGDSSACKKRSDCIKEDPCGYVMYQLKPSS